MTLISEQQRHGLSDKFELGLALGDKLDQSYFSISGSAIKKDKRICQLAIKQQLQSCLEVNLGHQQAKAFCVRESGGVWSSSEEGQREPPGEGQDLVTVTTGLGVNCCRPLLS